MAKKMSPSWEGGSLCSFSLCLDVFFAFGFPSFPPKEVWAPAFEEPLACVVNLRAGGSEGVPRNVHTHAHSRHRTSRHVLPARRYLLIGVLALPCTLPLSHVTVRSHSTCWRERRGLCVLYRKDNLLFSCWKNYSKGDYMQSTFIFAWNSTFLFSFFSFVYWWVSPFWLSVGCLAVCFWVEWTPWANQSGK